jgi:hypothetical protein
MKEGKYSELKLQHGGHVRKFKNVTVRKFKPYTSYDRNTNKKTQLSEERWELTGTELKQEVYPMKGVIEYREVPVEVTVGFLPENVVTE